MKILFISRFGDSYGLASKMAEEGSTVRYYIDDRKYSNKGKGIKDPERVRFYEPYLDRSDVIIFDMSGLGRLADSLRKRGYPVIGGSGIADRMEKDRAFAQGLVKKYCPGVTLPKYRQFTSIKDGIKFLEKEDRPFVFKPDSMPTNWTYVPRKDNNASVISVMKLCPKQNLSFILQEKVEGIEISTEGWFGSNGWIEGAFNCTMEEKRFLNKDWGPNCGCAGSVVWPVGENRLVSTLLLPLTGFLKSTGYIGPVDVNAIVNDETINFLEFTPRLGYDAIQNLSMLMEEKEEFFRNLLEGRVVSLKSETALSIRLSMPPYPASEDNARHAGGTEGMKAVEVPGGLKPNVMLVDVMEKDNELVMAGSDNVVGVVCVTGTEIEEMRDEAYGIIDEIALTSDLQFRTDIGKGVEEEKAALASWGWLENE